MPYSVLFYYIVMTILTEYITGFIKNATIIEKPRVFIKSRNSFFKGLLDCGYCLSVWISGAGVFLSYLVFEVPIVVDFFILNLIINVILISSFSNTWHGFKDRYIETYKDKRYYRKEDLVDYE